VGQQGQEAVIDQAGQRQRHTQRFGRGEHQAIIFKSQGSGKAGGLELLVGDQCAVGLVIQRIPLPWLVSKGFDSTLPSLMRYSFNGERFTDSRSCMVPDDIS
jgi:hypothetical protein